MFRFSNYVADNENFLACVKEGWDNVIECHAMYRVVKKLRLLKKKPLCKLMWSKDCLHANVIKIREDLDRIQKLLDEHPHSQDTRDEEIKTLKAYNDALWDEERFLKQKAKVEWLKAGDDNTSYFHKVVKAKNNRCRINAVMNSEGILVEGNDVPHVFVKHYIDFLGTNSTCMRMPIDQSMFDSKLSTDVATFMVRPVTDGEIKAAIFDIGDDKASGPDGYTSTFFKKAWDIVKAEVCQAVKDFFNNGQMLKEINHKIISLLPKVE
ncbi:uncharacterized protein [Rutidosis leptorrhynchoides]|uniref:uncharacterized protein n=1 Tax=Rutidosis leptorrhynchoides TaxID=125765 RepID=UPI003A99DE26